ncbi:acid phosphatase [Corynebacterium phocae]|uniref:Acid phosphatase n=1 Tax=Corynebacterium phocae TaxID=161895 RepID=A0A1L7D1U2_9CORY|nr:phosphatase PAP2 family protein [Corynebacterium phocae]APT92126.1 acid phosphatase [Corynebacterium phocae]KAA8726514.1 phosphatase PAP2 family protein [Corynebacterium phocae]
MLLSESSRLRYLLSTVVAASLVGSGTTAAQALPLTVPYLREPVTGQVIGTAPKLYPGAPVPEPFTTDYLGGYISDVSSYDFGVYWEVVRLFDSLKGQHPEIMRANLDKAIAINNAAAADPELIRRAQEDAAADKEGVMEAISDAMGPELGQAFRAALADNRLPKTQYLLGNGYAARAGGLASSTFPEKYYFQYRRPYQVAPAHVKRYPVAGKDLYPTSPSFPSGHTNQAVWITTLLAFMLPEVAPQLVFRGAQSGHSRVVMGVHYPLDVVGGRMTGQAAAADRLNDPRMRDALHQASVEIRKEIKWRTGKDVGELAATEIPYITAKQAAQEYSEYLGYGFTPTYHLDAPMVVPKAAPVLLEAAFPELTWQQREELLRITAAPAGHPLDWQGPGGSWQRINLVKALTSKVEVTSNRSLRVT